MSRVARGHGMSEVKLAPAGASIVCQACSLPIGCEARTRVAVLIVSQEQECPL